MTESSGMLIDSSEPSDVKSMVQRHFASAMVAPLGESCGDLWVYTSAGILVIERKEPSDLAASIADGRLFRQSEHIPTLCRFPFLVVDGELKYSDDSYLMGLRGRLGWVKTGWKRQSIESALIRVQLSGMCIWYESESYCNAIQSIVTQCEKADVLHVNRVKTRSANPLDNSTQSRIDFLAQLDGVGTIRAANLVQRYPDETLAQLIEWITKDDAHVRDVSQWGRGTIEKVRVQLGLRMKQHLKVETRCEWVEAT